MPGATHEAAKRALRHQRFSPEEPPPPKPKRTFAHAGGEVVVHNAAEAERKFRERKARIARQKEEEEHEDQERKRSSLVGQKFNLRKAGTDSAPSREAVWGKQHPQTQPENSTTKTVAQELAVSQSFAMATTANSSGKTGGGTGSKAPESQPRAASVTITAAEAAEAFAKVKNLPSDLQKLGVAAQNVRGLTDQVSKPQTAPKTVAELVKVLGEVDRLRLGLQNLLLEGPVGIGSNSDNAQKCVRDSADALNAFFAAVATIDVSSTSNSVAGSSQQQKQQSAVAKNQRMLAAAPTAAPAAAPATAAPKTQFRVTARAFVPGSSFAPKPAQPPQQYIPSATGYPQGYHPPNANQGPLTQQHRPQQHSHLQQAQPMMPLPRGGASYATSYRGSSR